MEEIEKQALLDEELWITVERKFMFLNDPLLSNSQPVTSTYEELQTLHRSMCQAKFGPWKQSTFSKNSCADQEGFLGFQRKVDIQLEEITHLLEKFQERVEESEAEQQHLAEDINKEHERVELIQKSLNETSNDFYERLECFETLIKESENMEQTMNKLLQQGTEKASLEVTLNKTENELNKAYSYIQTLENNEKKLMQQSSQVKQKYEAQVTSITKDYDQLKNKYEELKSTYNELHSKHYQSHTERSHEIENSENELGKLKRANAALKEELQTKEEIHKSLRENLESAFQREETLKAELETKKTEYRHKVSSADKTIQNLEDELSKVKNSWMNDVEKLSQLKLERDTLRTQVSFLDQKYQRTLTENDKLKQKVEELDVAAKANFEASQFEVSPEKSVRTATGSLSRLELEYKKEIERLKKLHEQELEKLREEVDWYQAKLDTERNWALSLDEANKKLQQELENLRYSSVK